MLGIPTPPELGAGNATSPLVVGGPLAIGPSVPRAILDMPLASDLSLRRGVGVATFTRSTIKTFLDRIDGLVKTAAIDVAAFEQEGYLGEGASTNQCLESETFDSATWLKLNSATVNANTTIAPDGTTTADTVNFTADQLSRLQQPITAIIGVDETTFIYARSDTPGAKFRISGETISADLNLTTSFQKFEITQTPTATGGTFQIRNASDGVARSINIWGAQREQLPFASSYIKTVASTVTRTADNLSIDAANIPAPTADYTISMEVDAIGFDSGLSQVLFNVAGETSRRIAWNTTTGAIEATHGAVTSVSTSTFSAGDRVKISFVVDATNQTLFINGIQEDQDAKGTVTGTATAINIGHQAGVNQAFSHIKPLRIFDVALTAAQARPLAIPPPPLAISAVFSTDLYTGNGADQTITTGIDMTGSNEGLVWYKSRSVSQSHTLIDTKRDVTKRLVSNSSAAEDTVAESLKSFNSDGFTLGSQITGNQSGTTYVSWSFKKAARFFDVITYTGDAVAGRTVAHNLGIAPGMVVIKRLDLAGNWAVQHISRGGTKVLRLNLTSAEAASTAFWNDTDADSSNVTLGSSSVVNESGATYVMYVFANDTESDGVIQCGQYIGNSSTTGPIINLGWKPQYIMFKNVSILSSWRIYDTSRGILDAGDDQALFPNTTNADIAIDELKLLSTGFQITSSAADINGSGNNIIFMAIRE